MKNITKTNLFTLILSLLVVVLVVSVQINGKSASGLSCSYLDPIYIDVLAFIAGLFLVLEGGYRIYEHKNNSLKKQFTRSIRIALGIGLLTLHVMQFLYK